ncbi:MAG: hypothetical protein R3F11_10930 [Verrucomicrobiales bacterium]
MNIEIVKLPEFRLALSATVTPSAAASKSSDLPEASAAGTSVL